MTMTDSGRVYNLLKLIQDYIPRIFLMKSEQIVT